MTCPARTVALFAVLIAGTRFAAVMAAAASACNRPTTFGTVTRTGLFTLTVTTADVPTLPATSVAIAVNVCGPFGTVVVFHTADAGEVALVASVVVVSSMIFRLARPDPFGSSAPVAVTVTLPRTFPPSGAVMAAVGGVKSISLPATMNRAELAIVATGEPPGPESRSTLMKLVPKGLPVTVCGTPTMPMNPGGVGMPTPSHTRNGNVLVVT